MRHAFVVMAHRDPDQLARLAGELVGPSRGVYVHLDARVDQAPFRSAVGSRLGAAAAEVRWVGQRGVVRWGGLSLFRSIVAAVRLAQVEGGADRYTVLSGADLLVRPVADLEQLDPQVEYLRIDRRIRPDRGLQADKLNRWWFDDSPVARLGGRLPRRWPATLPIRNGANFWSLTAECMAYVVRAGESDRALTAALRHAHCADEMIVPTIVAASPYAERVSQRYDLDPPAAGDGVRVHGLHYIHWEPDGWSPAWLTAADLPAIRASGAYFARKVDSVRSADLLTVIRSPR